MIVNVNQCASMFDETLHVFKFSAIAKQVNKSAGSVKSGSALVEIDINLLMHLLMIENNDSKLKKIMCTCIVCTAVPSQVVITQKPDIKTRLLQSAKKTADTKKRAVSISWATPGLYMTTHKKVTVPGL